MDFPQTRMLFRKYADIDGAREVIAATMRALADDLSSSAANDTDTRTQRRTVLANMAHELRLCSGDAN